MSVAFSACLSSPVCGLRNGDTVVFDEVISNLSSGYNPCKGVFVAPIKGTYVFTWTLTTARGKWLDTELIVGDTRMGYSVVDSTSAGDAQSASQTVVVQVEGNQQVFIRAGSRGDGACHENRQNTFSGWLLN